MNLMSLSVICVGSYLIMKNKMDIATLVTFNMYVASEQSPIRKLTQFTEQFTQGMAGFQRFRAIMHEDPDIVDAPDAVSLDHVDGDIEFKDVSFAYDEGKGDVLSHINLHIKPGEMLALVGQSGGGKSTLCQLIPRFYEISSGSIALDGTDIRRLSSPTCAAISASFSRMFSSLPVRFWTTFDTADRPQRWKKSSKRQRWQRFTTTSWRCRTDTKPSLASAASCSPADRSSVFPSRASS